MDRHDKRPRNQPLKTAAVLLLSVALCGLASQSIFAQEITDKNITLFVETELAHGEGVAAHRIDVSTREGVVSLSGNVGSLLAGERAVEIAQGVKGVRAVIDHLAVSPPPRSDQQILADLRQALQDDPATDVYEVSIMVQGGLVTLTGEVDSWAEKQICSQVTKGVKGIKGLNNNLTLKQKAVRIDEEIEADIKSRFRWDTRLSHDMIDIDVEMGQVTLAGVVGSAAEKRRAHGDAWVGGVVSVDHDQLRVDPNLTGDRLRSGKYAGISDDRVAQAVKDAFEYDPRVAPFDIGVDVTAGIVTLTGITDNLKARMSAEEDAMNTAGVWRVKNFIKVRSDLGSSQFPASLPYGTPGVMLEKIRAALARDPYVDQADISVTAVSRFRGTVYLDGMVDSEFEKRRAEDVVSRLRQVVHIFNDIQVGREWRGKSDWEILQDIEGELWWSPYVESDHIAVTVEDGIAILTGVVEDLRERRIATENAYEGGAREVRNFLKVRNGPPSLAP
ncbi:MAG: BON domain-containing protein [Desulfatiglandales bacterium]